MAGGRGPASRREVRQATSRLETRTSLHSLSIFYWHALSSYFCLYGELIEGKEPTMKVLGDPILGSATGKFCRYFCAVSSCAVTSAPCEFHSPQSPGCTRIQVPILGALLIPGLGSSDRTGCSSKTWENRRPKMAAPDGRPWPYKKGARRNTQIVDGFCLHPVVKSLTCDRICFCRLVPCAGIYLVPASALSLMSIVSHWTAK